MNPFSLFSRYMDCYKNPRILRIFARFLHFIIILSLITTTFHNNVGIVTANQTEETQSSTALLQPILNNAEKIAPNMAISDKEGDDAQPLSATVPLPRKLVPTQKTDNEEPGFGKTDSIGSKSINGFEKREGTVVEEDVYTALKENKEVHVIINLQTKNSNVPTGKREAIKKAQDTVLTSLSTNDFKLTHRYGMAPAMSGSITAKGVAAIEKHPDIELIQLDREVKLSMAEAIKAIHADTVHDDYSVTGEGVNVAVIDSGIDTDSPDLSDDIVVQKCYNLDGSCPGATPSNPYESDNAEDWNGHGTVISTIITSKGVQNPEGLAPDAGIVAVRIAGPGGFYLSDVISGLDWVLDHQSQYNISVVNLSFSLAGYYFTANCDRNWTALSSILIQLSNLGVIIFASSGNDGLNIGISLPACMSGVTAVGATYDSDDLGREPDSGFYSQYESFTANCYDSSTSVDKIACYTNTSTTLLDLVAPGSIITVSGVPWMGTSFSSAIASGVAALIKQAKPSMASGELESILKSTGEPAHRGSETFPQIDAWKALGKVTSVLDPIVGGDPWNQCPAKNFASGSQGYSANPINTRTGNHTYSNTDLSLSTQCTSLQFTRDYSTFNARDVAAGNLVPGVLSPGWVHNFEVRLLSSADPGGEANKVMLQTAGGSRMGFLVTASGDYQADFGVGGALKYNSSTQTYTYDNGQGTGYDFDDQRRLSAIFNDRGERLNFIYNSGSGLLEKVQEATGQRYLTFQYETFFNHHRLIGVADQTGRGISFGYTSFGSGEWDYNLSSFTDLQGETWTYQYNNSTFPHFLTDRLDPSGALIIHYNYDTQGRAYEERNGKNQVITHLTFNPDGTTTVQNGVGETQTHTYDYRKTLTSQSNAAGSSAIVYDHNFLPVETSDGNGNPTEYSWSRNGENLLSVTNSVSETTILEYDTHNHVTLITNPDSVKTKYIYNLPGATNPLTNTVIYNPAWDEDVLLVRIDNYILGGSGADVNLATQYTYTSTLDAPEPASLIRRIDAPGNSTCYVYNSFGQAIQVYQNCVDMNPATGSIGEDLQTSYAFDNVGRLVSITDAAGQVTRNTYSDQDDLVDEVIRNYDITKLPYQDGLWNLATIYLYDVSGRQTDIITNAYDGDLSGNGQVEPAMTLDLNKDGNADYRIEIDPNKPEYNVITHTNYDAAGQVSETITNYWPGHPAYDQNLYNLSQRMFYDAAGRMVATVQNYTENDLAGWGSPQSMDFDLDGTTDATIEINPDHPEYNRISQTKYDPTGRTSLTIRVAWPGAAYYYQPAGSSSIYNLVSASEYDAAGNVIKTIDNFDPNWSDSDGDGFTVPVLLNPAGAPVNILVDPDAPDRNQITCTQLDALNRPLYVRSACIPGQEDYLKVGDNLYNLVNYSVYDQAGNLIASVRNFNDPNGDGALDLTSQYNFITRTFYDDLSRVTYSVNNFVGDVSSSTVPAFDPTTPDRNLVTRYYYDGNGRQIATVQNYWEPTGSADGNLSQGEIEAGWPDKNRVSHTYYDGVGQVTDTVENFVGDIFATEPPTYNPATPDRNLISSFTYDVLGRQIIIQTDRGLDGIRANHVEYNALGQVDRQIVNYVDGVYDPAVKDVDVITGFGYDILGRQIQTTDPEGRIRKVIYNALGYRLQTIVDPAGLAITDSNQTDVAGQVIRTINGEGEAVGYQYNALDQLVRTDQDPDGLDLATTQTYDLSGHVVTSTDAKGIAKHYVYDNQGRLNTVIENFSPAHADASWPACGNDSDGVNVCAHYEYDNAGNQVQVTQGNGGIITYAYDALGRQSRETIDPYDAANNPDGANITTEYGYNAAGNRVRVTNDPGGTHERIVTYAFDALSRTLTINYPDTTPDVSYTYDSFGNRSTMVDGIGDWHYGYDQLNHLTSVTDPNGKVVSYGYDASGNRTHLLLSGSPLDVTYHYDAASRNDFFTNPFANNNLVSYGYDNANRLVSTNLPTGIAVSYQYDAAGRLEHLLNGTNGGLSSFDYILDQLGNRADATEMLSLPTGGLGLINPAQSQERTATSGLLAIGTQKPSGSLSLASWQEPSEGAHSGSNSVRAYGNNGRLFKPSVGMPGSLPAAQPIFTSIRAEKVPASKKPENAFVVTSVSDSDDINAGDGICDDGTGSCSLRAAIEESNALSGKDTIAFDLPGSASYTIQLLSPLPTITDALVIDGTTEPDFAGIPLIELAGDQAGFDADGLVIQAGNSEVRGIVINRFGASGIRLETNGNNVIESNYIGTDTTGMQSMGNRIGILIDNSNGNRIGGSEAAARNLISGNRIGVWINRPGAHHNVIHGNSIGTDAQGHPSLANADTGIVLISANNNLVGGGTEGESNDIIGGLQDISIEGQEVAENQIAGNRFFGKRGPTSEDFRNPEGVPLEGETSSNGQSANQHENSPLSSSVEGMTPDHPIVTGLATKPSLSLVSWVKAAPLIQGATYIVNSTADDADKNTSDGICDNGKGKCTLRAAIQQANAVSGLDTITFNLTGTAPFLITPRSALPAITSPVVIDATTQSGYTLNTPKIELRGTNAGTSSRGLVISAGGSTVRGLVITGFADAAIELNTNGGNTIEATFLGVTTNGTTAQANRYGIVITGSSNNVIGGSMSSKRNLISGNTSNGVVITSSASSNQMKGNWIGTNVTGEVALSNYYGVAISNATNNTVGGTTTGDRNIIAGNNSDGIYISNGSSGNQVQGNWIGLKASGSAALGNYSDAVEIENASNNVVGGTAAGARNVLSGNGDNGVLLQGSTASGNQVIGNYIGTNVDGSALIGNTDDGIVIDAAPNSVIGGTGSGAGNVISGNRCGVLVYIDTTGAMIQGNLIGTNATGTAILGNTTYGVSSDTATNNTIGGTAVGARNVISGNLYGVYLYNSADSLVQGNYVGTDITGTASLGNTNYGVVVSVGSNNTIGGASQAARNVISGNGKVGVLVSSPGTTGTVIQGNFIGTDVTGTAVLGNGERGVQAQNGPADTKIGGTEPGEGNLIAGNSWYGIRVTTNGTDNTIGTLIQGNTIGTNSAGSTTLGNLLEGVSINAINTTIGGTTAGARNIIAYNGGDGVYLEDMYGSGNTGNRVLQNQIYANGGLGIDIAPDGITLNDAGDADTGPNNLQNFPIITSATSDGVQSTIQGTLSSTPAINFRVEFFANSSCDPSGNGEGEQYLGSVDTTTNGDGIASFTAGSIGGFTGTRYITATATDPAGNTSEFSACKTSGTEEPPTSESHNWHYTYDNLQRLTGACPNWNGTTNTCLGDQFTYSYDGAGNQKSFSRWNTTNHAIETVNFVFNSANQIVCLDGNNNGACGDLGDIAYQYDAYGNLTSNGVKTYSYDAANRLISTSDSSGTTSYSYTGDGDRLRETINGAMQTFVLDTALSLTQVLAMTRRADIEYYLHGLDLVAQSGGTGEAYFLYDGLGSVRQMVDTAGSVISAQSFDPYGNPITRTESQSSNWGYTGEWSPSSTNLLYLRARFYNPASGVFIAKDDWPGSQYKPISFNSWAYAYDNPINLVDRSGNSPEAFFTCFGLVAAGGVTNGAILGNLTVGEAINICRAGFERTSWKGSFDCNAAWSEPNSVTDLMRDYICEIGKESYEFQGSHRLTKALAKSIVVNDIRNIYYDKGEVQKQEWPFSYFQFAQASLDILRGCFQNSVCDDSAIVHFLGSFDVAVKSLPSGRVGFWIHNQTDRGSGSHFVGRFKDNYTDSIEDLVRAGKIQNNDRLADILFQKDKFRVISVLSAKSREQTTGLEGGGNMEQTFVWSEKQLDCTMRMLPPAIYWSLLDIADWPDYGSSITQ